MSPRRETAVSSEASPNEQKSAAAYRPTLDPALGVEVQTAAAVFGMSEKVVRGVVDQSIREFVESHLIGNVQQLVLNELGKRVGERAW